MPERKNRYAALVALAIVLILSAVFFLRPKPDLTLIGPEVKAYRVVYGGRPTPAAHVSVPFTRDDATYAFMNVAIDLNKDGRIAAYPSGGATQEEWVVKNQRAKVIVAGNDFSFDLVDRAVDGGRDFPLVASLTKSPIDGWNGKPRGASAAAVLTISGFEPEDFAPLFTASDRPNSAGALGLLDVPPTPDDAPGAPTLADPGPAIRARGNEPWLSDLSAGADPAAAAAPAIGATPAADVPPPAGSDFEVFQPGVPDMTQGHNECVPTSISNGLTWLGERYGFKDKLPPTQLETREELKGDLNWRREYGADMGNNVVNAKVAFSRRHGLPIVTHRIGTRLDEEIVRKVAAELRKGQAVEIGVGYYTYSATSGSWTRHGGHMVSAVGAFGAGGKEYLGVHDPLSPESGRLDIYPVDKNRLFEYRYRGNTKVFIEYAYAQSPTAEWVAQHPPAVALDTGGAVEAANLQDVMFVDAIEIGSAWYPVKQFHAGTGPECAGAEHWHANDGAAWGVDRGGFTPAQLTNPEAVYRARREVVEWRDPDGCGAGKTSEVSRATILISESEAGQLVSKIVR